MIIKIVILIPHNTRTIHMGYKISNALTSKLTRHNWLNLITITNDIGTYLPSSIYYFEVDVKYGMKNCTNCTKTLSFP